MGNRDWAAALFVFHLVQFFQGALQNLFVGRASLLRPSFNQIDARMHGVNGLTAGQWQRVAARGQFQFFAWDARHRAISFPRAGHLRHAGRSARAAGEVAALAAEDPSASSDAARLWRQADK